MEGLSIKQRFQETLKSVYFPFVAIVVSLLFGSVVILATSSTSPLTAYGHMLKGAFGSIAAFDSTLIKAIPLIFTALSFSLARRSGIINLGAEGQFMMGALAATAVGVATLICLRLFTCLPRCWRDSSRRPVRTDYRCVESQIWRIGAYHYDHAQLHCEGAYFLLRKRSVDG